ncbi:MAG: bifunctional YncE family protein/alkaline phosphatase family protein [Blastocatellia bacterium]
MKPLHASRPPFRALTLFIAATAILLAACLWFLLPAAVTQTTDEPAAQGRPISPAGHLLQDATTRQPAVGALPVSFVRSPDNTGPQGKGRYLIAVNSGYGVRFSAVTNPHQQSLAVIDLAAAPEPVVIQNVYFPSPQSANLGLVFAPQPDGDGAWKMYVSGGVENKIRVFRFDAAAGQPVSPASNGPDTKIEAPFIDVSGLAPQAPAAHYNDGHAPFYAMEIALSPDGDTLFVAGNLGDNLGIVGNLRNDRTLTRIDLHRENKAEFVYPYGVTALPAADNKSVAKVYVSCWNTASVAVIDPRNSGKTPNFISVDRHPTVMTLNAARTRLFVANSNADNISVIDTATDREIERISVKLSEKAPVGHSPVSLALGADEKTLYVANANSNAIAVVALGETTRGATATRNATGSRLRGFIPTGQYPSAVAAVGSMLFVGNGKGTGFANSSMTANNSGRAPNLPNERFPAVPGRTRGGQNISSLTSGNISLISEPGEAQLAQYTAQVMRNDGLTGEIKTKLFSGDSPIKHVIYIIRENRTYDQVFGDLARAGDGTPADADPALAIFGAGEAARIMTGPDRGRAQNVTPNAHALATRFGLLDRFFVNSEASPDGHNWSTAAFSSDYVDKAWRWEYSDRGRTYDWEGFNRLPSYEPPGSLPPVFALPVTGDDVAKHMQRYVPYLNGSRDVAEPDTLYLWDAAARAGLRYRNYGEFIGTISEADVTALNARRRKSYPDLTPLVKAFATKKSLEGNFSPGFHAYDMSHPDIMTVDSYRAWRGNNSLDPAITRNNPDPNHRGTTRFGEWLHEFEQYAADARAGRPDRLPQLTTMRFPNDHTSGLSPGAPTPQFHVGENDYALGRLVEAVSNSPYWKDTAIFVIEDDAQDGADHVDCHRSPALVISAYNKPGTLVHQFHSTVSLIRTMEILLGMAPMNQLDASAPPIDIFRETPDLTPYKALMPDIAPGNLTVPPARDARTAYWINRTSQQDLAHADMADPRVLNEIIWYSVKGDTQPMPGIARLPLFDVMREGLAQRSREHEEEDEEELEEKIADMKRELARARAREIRRGQR